MQHDDSYDANSYQDVPERKRYQTQEILEVLAFLGWHQSAATINRWKRGEKTTLTHERELTIAVGLLQDRDRRRMSDWRNGF